MYYHGTSTALKIKGFILPATVTNIIREERNIYKDYVFCTDSLKSAEKFARNAVEKFGGEPIIYIVEPLNEDEIQARMNHEFIAKDLKIVDVYKGM